MNLYRCSFRIFEIFSENLSGCKPSSQLGKPMHMWRLQNIHSKIAQMNPIISTYSNFFGYDSYHTKSKAHKLRNHFILVLRSTTKLAPPSGHLFKICSFSQFSLLKYHWSLPIRKKNKVLIYSLYEWNDCIAFEVSWKRILYLKPYILSWTYRGYVSDSGFNISILESVK